MPGRGDHFQFGAAAIHPFAVTQAPFRGPGFVLQAVVGAKQLIPALDSALVGMRKGGSRRLFVVPEKGWKKINASCSAATNGASNAGDASAGGLDVLGQAVVPLAEIVDNDACIEDVLLPQPRNFGAKRRLARRFDEGLLVEVEVVDLAATGRII